MADHALENQNVTRTASAGIPRADEVAHAPKSMGLQELSSVPMPQSERDDPSGSGFEWLQNFLGQLFEKYNVPMRWLGYSIAALYSPITRLVSGVRALYDKAHQSNLDHIEQSWNRGQVRHDAASGIYRTTNSSGTEPARFQLDGKANGTFSREHVLVECKGNRYNKVSDSIYDWSKTFTNRLETALFLAISTVWFFVERKQMQRMFGQAVGAELGIPSEEVGLRAMMKSKNPMVQIAMRRFGFFNVLRFATDLVFSVNLNIGIAVKALDIICERGLMADRTDIEQLKAEVKSAIQGGFSDREVPFMPRVFKLVIARTRSDYGLPPLGDARVKEMEPVLQDIARYLTHCRVTIPSETSAREAKQITDNAVTKAMNEMVYLMGEGLVTGDVKRASAALERLETIGLQGIARLHSADASGVPVASVHSASTPPLQNPLPSTPEPKMADGLPGVPSAASKSVAAILARGRKAGGELAATGTNGPAYAGVS